MTKASINLKHNQFEIAGPPELVLWIKALQGTTASGEAIHMVFMKKMADYFVHCSITGDEIPLSELKYWNVDRQEPYKNAGVGLARYTEMLSKT